MEARVGIELSIRERSRRPSQTILRFIILCDNVYVIRTRARQVLLCLNILKDDADPELFAFPAEAKGFRSGLQTVPGNANLIEKRVNACVAFDYLASDCIFEFYLRKFNGFQSRFGSTGSSSVKQSSRSNTPAKSQDIIF